MSDSESDGLNFDDEDLQSPKQRAETPNMSEEQLDLFDDQDSDDHQPKSKQESPNEAIQSSGKKDISSDEISDIFNESDSDDEKNKRKKVPQKQKQAQKESFQEQQKSQLRQQQTAKERQQQQQQQSDKKKSQCQQKNQSGNKKAQPGQNSQQKVTNEPLRPLIDESTKIRVNEQQKNIQGGYEKKETLTVLTRSVLETADLRNFHNWIKSVIIKKYSDEVKQIIKIKEDLRETKNQLFIMEIACGQGGDLKKWLHADIALYVGADISFNSLKEASRRTKDIMDKLPPFKRFKYGFYQKDGSANREDFWKYIQDPEEKDKNKRFFFDMVSCQMAMHYMFGSEQHARNFFDNATYRLNNKGFLILTFSDSNAIVKKMRNRSKVDPNTNKHVFGNKYFSMAFDSLNFPPGKPYGLQYEFYLADAVGEKDEATGQIKYTPEYLVEINNLINLALEYKLVVKENLNFIEFYKSYRLQFANLFKTMRLDQFNEDHPSIDPELWEISHCYRVVVFQKIDLQADVNFKEYSFTRNPHFKQISQDPIPINYVPQLYQRPNKY